MGSVQHRSRARSACCTRAERRARGRREAAYGRIVTWPRWRRLPTCLYPKNDRLFQTGSRAIRAQVGASAKEATMQGSDKQVIVQWFRQLSPKDRMSLRRWPARDAVIVTHFVESEE